MNITPEQSQALLDAGHISPETHQAVLSANGINSDPTAALVAATPVTERDTLIAQNKKDLESSLGSGSFAPAGDQTSADAIQKEAEARADSMLSGKAQSEAAAAKHDAAVAENLKQQQMAAGASPDQTVRAPASSDTVATSQAAPEKVSAGAEQSASAPAGEVALASDKAKPAASPTGFNVADAARKTEGAINLMQDATINGAAAGAHQAAAEAMYYKKSIAEQEQMMTEAKLREQNRQSHMTEQNNKLQALTDQYAKQKIDPNHFWADKSTGQKITMSIGLFLGGLGAGVNNNGVNQASQLLESAMNRDMEAQKQNADKLGKQVSAQQNVYQNMREQFGDERQAEAATRLMYLNKVQTQMQQVAAQYKGPQVMAQAQQGYGQLEIMKQKAAQEFNAAAQQSAQFSNADEMTKKIAMLPPTQHADAFKEMGAVQQLNKSIDAIRGSAAKADDLQSYASRIGSPIQSAAQLKSQNAVLTASVMGAIDMKRFPSEEAFQQIIEPFLPKLRESAETRKKNTEALIDLVKKNAPATPILTGFGIAKPEIKVTKVSK